MDLVLLDLVEKSKVIFKHFSVPDQIALHEQRKNWIVYQFRLLRPEKDQAEIKSLVSNVDDIKIIDHLVDKIKSLELRVKELSDANECA